MLPEALGSALADTFAFYLKAHMFHWNVEGPNFPQYHALFKDLYEDTHGAADDLAEKIRTLGVKAPTTVEDLLGPTSVDLKMVPEDAACMIRCLVDANQIVVTSLDEAMTLAESSGQPGIANFLQGRLDQHGKWGWMLQATLKDDSARLSNRRALMYDRSVRH